MNIMDLKALEEAASPGPWDTLRLPVPPDFEEAPRTFAAVYVEGCISKGGADFHIVGATLPDGRADVCHTGNGPTSLVNARLISAVRNCLPALIRVVEAATVVDQVAPTIFKGEPPQAVLDLHRVLRELKEQP